MIVFEWLLFSTDFTTQNIRLKKTDVLERFCLFYFLNKHVRTVINDGGMVKCGSEVELTVIIFLLFHSTVGTGR